MPTISCVAIAAFGAAFSASPPATAQDHPPARYAADDERPDTTARVAEAGESPGFVGLRVLLPIYLDDVTMPGGRDYVSGDPQLGWGLRLDGSVYVVGGLTVGFALAFAYNAMTPQLTGDTRDVLTDVFAALLVGYRGTIAERVVIGGSVGVAYHTVDPAEGGWGGIAELELGVKVHPHVVVSAGVSLEALGSVSQSNSPVLRVTPALMCELLL